MWDEPANSTVKYTTLKPPSDVAYKAVNPVDAEEEALVATNLLEEKMIKTTAN